MTTVTNETQTGVQPLIPAQRGGDETPSPDFSYYTFINLTRRDHPTMAPDALTKQVLSDLPAEHVPAALEQATRRMVSGSITSRTDDNPRPFLRPARQLDSSRSWKTEASRQEPWAEHLEEPFYIVPGGENWGAFGDSTTDDMREAARRRRHLAAGIIDGADACDEWAELHVTHGVGRNRDLPTDVLRDRLARGGVA